MRRRNSNCDFDSSGGKETGSGAVRRREVVLEGGDSEFLVRDLAGEMFLLS